MIRQIIATLVVACTAFAVPIQHPIPVPQQTQVRYPSDVHLPTSHALTHQRRPVATHRVDPVHLPHPTLAPVVQAIPVKVHLNQLNQGQYNPAQHQSGQYNQAQNLEGQYQHQQNQYQHQQSQQHQYQNQQSQHNQNQHRQNQQYHSHSGIDVTPIPIILSEGGLNEDGSWDMRYETGNGITMHEVGYQKSVHDDEGKPSVGAVAQGTYSYTSPEGIQITMTYTADEHGFRAEGNHLPTPPPIPEAIQKSLDLIARVNGLNSVNQYEFQ